MQKFVILILFVFSTSSYSSGFASSIGIGLKYGGMIGYQASVSKGKHNLRGGIGLFGGSVGYDYKLFKYVSVGATAGEYSSIVSVSRFHNLDFTYHTSGNYNDGWHISLGMGKSRCSADCKVY